ncbi:MAG: vanadium-dependent haloperoxidase, partial [Cyanobacteria bacterium P01_G01_bin.19]
NDRRQESYAIRLEAAELARSRNHPDHKANGEEQKYAGDKYFMSFTKGLPHNPDTGLLEDALDFVEFRRAIDEGFIDPFTQKVKHGAKTSACPDNFRQWEAPTAGVAFELQGPDPQAVTMPPAPPLVDTNSRLNPELVIEMAEVYELAILRDKPFNAFETNAGDADINATIDRLNALPYIRDRIWIDNPTGRPRKLNSGGQLDLQTVFRGSSPGVEVGPYLSQFLLIGNNDRNNGGGVDEGLITYGVQRINQKVPIAEPRRNYMTTMPEYVAVQNGVKPATGETYGATNGGAVAAPARPPQRFISTLRDLATYVHYDALYQAYLNACIILLGMETPFDPGFDHLSGGGVAAGNVDTRRHAGGFALYGGPHILNLVTEVSTRALKAVRFQKFNDHIRLRPEALAARIDLAQNFNNLSPDIQQCVPHAFQEIRDPDNNNNVVCRGEILELKEALENTNGNGTLNALGGTNYLLPMAFPEGSPMHPAYGAGHATVAGACVTILKAFFDTSAVLVGDTNNPANARFRRFIPGDSAIAFRAPTLPGPEEGEGVPTQNGLPKRLTPYNPGCFLTLEGELNKLAANISIGRNMAGVHYFTDYYDSVRMGEEIAIGILEEQALTYSTDPFVLSLPTFDGDVVRIGRR